MHRWGLVFVVLIGILMGIIVAVFPVLAAQPEGQALVQIPLAEGTSPQQVEATGATVYARLAGIDGPYVLAGAAPRAIRALRVRGLDVVTLDPDVAGARYYLVAARPAGPRPDWAAYGRPLLDDGVQVLFRATAQEADDLARAGFEVALLPREGIVLQARPAGQMSNSVQPDLGVQAMLDQVDANRLYQYEAWLSGEEAVVIDGAPYTITTRYTNSGTPIRRATQFAYEHLADLGLQVEYDQWGEATYPNVVATQAGATHPEKVYLISAHLDDMPAFGAAPGADDNASGSAAVLMIADILSQYDFSCTLKYALWTGEELGLLGSQAWAEAAADEGLEIGGVLNLDMIGYDSDEDPVLDLHARSWLPESVTMANLFADVVAAYDLRLAPEIFIDDWLGNYSDNKSFWDEGYTAILAIEDKDDFTPWYHTAKDRLSTLNLSYLTDFVRASLGTLVHTSGCYLPQAVHDLAFTWSPISPMAGHAVDLTATAQGDVPLHFAWDLGDGSHAAGVTATHVYGAEGMYTVTVTATNAYGLAVVSDRLAVLPAICEPVQILTVGAEISGCVATLDAKLVGTPPFTYSWALDPIGSSTAPTVTLDLDGSGTYSYSLAVANCGGDGFDVSTDTVFLACETRQIRYLPLVMRG